MKAQDGQYLTFNLNNQEYGVCIGTVREINQVLDITPVPQTPSFVAGVMNLRGRVIPVVNLRKKFGMDAVANTKQTCIIVIESLDSQVGMIVDSVKGVVDLKPEQIEESPALGDESKMAFIMGMGKTEENVIILVDIQKALSKEELSKISELEKATPPNTERKAA
jgi:purine-binding chemotaxis protein CheW